MIMGKWIILAALLFLISSCSFNSEQDKEEISKLAENYLNSLAREIRESGVTSIDINSKDIQLKWDEAVATLNITFNVYHLPTNEMRQDRDVATFSLKKANGEWQIAEVKYQKTKW